MRSFQGNEAGLNSEKYRFRERPGGGWGGGGGAVIKIKENDK